jgi:hypothetical protein
VTLVTPERLNNYMSSPQWTEEQKEAVLDILDGVEAELEGELSGAYLTPREMFEVAPILPSGLLATRQPVYSVLSVDGVDVDDTHPLQLPWVHTEHRLRHTATTGVPPGVLTLPSTSDAWGSANVPRVENAGQATVRYLGGWGPYRPISAARIPTSALEFAILKKARAITNNRFDDTIGVNGTDNENVNRPERESWTDAELKPLGIFRNIGAYR